MPQDYNDQERESERERLTITVARARVTERVEIGSHRESRDWESQRAKIGHFQRTVLDVIMGILSFDVNFQCHINY